eukprot:TRINITY_DN15769_c0_g2_i1.p1 TRINITY_DN15769_c0_g2~~TRINITY_DN15769_c0_g2_i1.p1  ORF type:complete len:338 (+),score=61.45 TRINITY_DN15769_c0_g2_i1:79-1014(+)
MMSYAAQPQMIQPTPAMGLAQLNQLQQMNQQIMQNQITAMNINNMNMGMIQPQAQPYYYVVAPGMQPVPSVMQQPQVPSMLGVPMPITIPNNEIVDKSVKKESCESDSGSGQTRSNSSSEAPTTPQSMIGVRSCEHNSWDNVRVGKGNKMMTLRCRVCQSQWRAHVDDVWENLRCEAFTADAKCPKGDSCPKVHLHFRKEGLKQRMERFGTEIFRGKTTTRPEVQAVLDAFEAQKLSNETANAENNAAAPTQTADKVSTEPEVVEPAAPAPTPAPRRSGAILSSVTENESQENTQFLAEEVAHAVLSDLFD